MSAFTSPIAAVSRTAPVSRSRGVWSAWLAVFFRTVGTRGGLSEMDERLLKDVGLTRMDAKREAARKPWDI